MKTTSEIFKALSSPVRRQILQELKEKELSAGEIGSLFEMTGPSVSRHLTILKSAGLIHEKKKGNFIIYGSEAETLASCLNDFISQVCPTQLLKAQKIKKKKKQN